MPLHNRPPIATVSETAAPSPLVSTPPKPPPVSKLSKPPPKLLEQESSSSDDDDTSSSSASSSSSSSSSSSDSSSDSDSSSADNRKAQEEIDSAEKLRTDTKLKPQNSMVIKFLSPPPAGSSAPPALIVEEPESPREVVSPSVPKEEPLVKARQNETLEVKRTTQVGDLIMDHFDLDDEVPRLMKKKDQVIFGIYFVIR